MPCCAHVRGVHICGGGTSGAMHDERSNSRYSNTFSCAFIGLTEQWPGNVWPPLEALITWKSLNSTRPHWFCGIAVVGALKVYSSGIVGGPPQRPICPPPPQICGAGQLVPPSARVHVMLPPQPLPNVPHSNPNEAHVRGTQVPPCPHTPGVPPPPHELPPLQPPQLRVVP